MIRGLLDTSIVIALAHGEAIQLPDGAAISAVTLCELHHGVLIADETHTRDRDFEQLDEVEVVLV